MYQNTSDKTLAKRVVATTKPEHVPDWFWQEFGYSYFEIPCHKRGCDFEGSVHNEDAMGFDGLEDAVDTVSHSITIADGIEISALGDRPWELAGESFEIRGTGELERFANYVRCAVNLATDLNADIVPHWMQDPTATTRWVRL